MTTAGLTRALTRGLTGSLVPRRYRYGGGGGGATYATWNPADKGADIGLSGGDLVVTNTSGGGSWQSARATVGKSTGKFKVEILVEGAGSPGQDVIVGIGTDAASVSQFVGQNANSWGLHGNAGGTRWHSGAGTASFGADFQEGGIVAVLLDLDAMTVKFRYNGGSYTIDTDISALSGNDIYFMCAVYASTRTATANFGATDFAYSDSGYIGVSV